MFFYFPMGTLLLQQQERKAKSKSAVIKLDLIVRLNNLEMFTLCTRRHYDSVNMIHLQKI